MCCGENCCECLLRFWMCFLSTIYFLILWLPIFLAGLSVYVGLKIVLTILFKVVIEEGLKTTGMKIVGNSDNLINLIIEYSNAIAILLMIMGVAIFIIGIVGCVAGCCMNKGTVLFYLVVAGLFLGAYAIGVAYFFSTEQERKDNLLGDLRAPIKESFVGMIYVSCVYSTP